MSENLSPGPGPKDGSPDPRGSGPTIVWLERVTAAILVLVILSLSWMVLAAYRPDWASVLSAEAEVILVGGILVAALILVTVVALLHTRP
jgi:hypothetical protein